MRVVSGEFRGRKLETPRGFDVRPTADMVKESVFNIIRFDLPGARALDLFAGTGQLGLEALSCGARECVFADKSDKSLALARRNAAIVGAGERARFVRADAEEYLSRGERFDLIFLDPPYDTDLLNEALASVIRFDNLTKHGIILCESRAEKETPEFGHYIEKRREYRYGQTKITLYARLCGEDF